MVVVVADHGPGERPPALTFRQARSTHVYIRAMGSNTHLPLGGARSGPYRLLRTSGALAFCVRSEVFSCSFSRPLPMSTHASLRPLSLTLVLPTAVCRRCSYCTSFYAFSFSGYWSRPSTSTVRPSWLLGSLGCGHFPKGPVSFRTLELIPCSKDECNREGAVEGPLLNSEHPL